MTGAGTNPPGAEVLAVDSLTLEAPERRRGPHRGRGRGLIANRVSLAVHPHEIVGLIGESGSGKTLTAKALLGLLPRGVRVAGGHAWFEGRDLLALPPAEIRDLRGDRFAFIPQDALHSLNPVLRVGRQVGEPLVIHRGERWRNALARAVEMLRAVRLDRPERQARAYPFELSGGMQQRAIPHCITLKPSS